jgi:hypothetical protein
MAKDFDPRFVSVVDGEVKVPACTRRTVTGRHRVGLADHA